jgi:hypothetical protein
MGASGRGWVQERQNENGCILYPYMKIEE